MGGQPAVVGESGGEDEGAGGGLASVGDAGAADGGLSLGEDESDVGEGGGEVVGDDARERGAVAGDGGALQDAGLLLDGGELPVGRGVEVGAELLDGGPCGDGDGVGLAGLDDVGGVVGESFVPADGGGGRLPGGEERLGTVAGGSVFRGRFEGDGGAAVGREHDADPTACACGDVVRVSGRDGVDDGQVGGGDAFRAQGGGAGPCQGGEGRGAGDEGDPGVVVEVALFEQEVPDGPGDEPVGDEDDEPEEDALDGASGAVDGGGDIVVEIDGGA